MPQVFVDAIVTIGALAAASYLTSAAFVVVRRLRYDRRHRLMQRLEAALAASLPGAGGPGQDDGMRRAVDLLSREPIELVIRLAAESSASRTAGEALAQSVVSRLGLDSIRLTAASHRNSRRQIDALRILALAGSADACACIERAMAEGRRDVVAASVVLLGRLPDIRAAKLLVDVLRRNAYARSRVATSLDAFPLDIRALVAPLLVSADGQVRYWGVLLMRRYSDAEGLPRVLATLTGDPEASVRKAALEAIGIARHPGCEGAVRARLGDPIPFVRAHAARALGALRACSAAGAMLPLLADREWLVRSAAKQSLEAMGREIAPLVLEMLTHEDAFARNGATEVLQNLGVFDAFVAGHASGTADGDTVQTVEAPAGAAGPRMRAAVHLRLNDTARARTLGASAGIPPAR